MATDSVLSGRECAALVRGWLAAETFGRMKLPPEGAEMLLEGLAWLDSDEPLLTERALYAQYVAKISLPIRLVLIAQALERERLR